MNPNFLSISLLTSILLLAPFWSIAGNQDKINDVMKMDTAPFGVVFEILDSDEDSLDRLIPEIQKYSTQLRRHFPDIGIAVVSHGDELFALTKEEAGQHKKLHNAVKSLLKDDDIPVHICGTYASWSGKKPDDFPSYVDVTPAGPTAISNYEEMGYELIVLD